MKMLFDHVLLKETKEESKIVMADDRRTPVGIGIVEGVGPGQIGTGDAAIDTRWYNIPCTLKKGDKVYYIKDHALKIKEWIVCRERDCICVE